MTKARFQPYGGAGPLPTDCCDFAVVDTKTGKEVCRVWDEEDARRIADLLETAQPKQEDCDSAKQR